MKKVTERVWARIRVPELGNVPLESGKYIDAKRYGSSYFECSQPDSRDDKEFNLRLRMGNTRIKGRGYAYARSIDFDFFTFAEMTEGK